MANAIILRLLLRKLVLSLAVLIALLFVNPVLYPALGIVCAIAMMPILLPKFLERGQRVYQYWPVFLISALTWPDSILTQALRSIK